MRLEKASSEDVFELEFNTVEINFDDIESVEEWMILNQFGRRNIPNFVRAELALKLKPLLAEKAKENQIRKPVNSVSLTSGKQNSIDTEKELAKKSGVGKDTISKVEKILAVADEETKEKQTLQLFSQKVVREK